MKDSTILRLTAIISGLVIVETAIVSGVNGMLYFIGGGLIAAGAKLPFKLWADKKAK